MKFKILIEIKFNDRIKREMFIINARNNDTAIAIAIDRAVKKYSNEKGYVGLGTIRKLTTRKLNRFDFINE